MGIMGERTKWRTKFSFSSLVGLPLCSAMLKRAYSSCASRE